MRGMHRTCYKVLSLSLPATHNFKHPLSMHHEFMAEHASPYRVQTDSQQTDHTLHAMPHGARQRHTAACMRRTNDARLCQNINAYHIKPVTLQSKHRIGLYRCFACIWQYYPASSAHVRPTATSSDERICFSGSPPLCFISVILLFIFHFILHSWVIELTTP